MLKHLKYAGALGALLLAAEPVKAADWTGVHVGVGVGAGAIVHELNLSVPPLAGTNVNFNGLGGEGGFLTLQLGADIQVAPRFVLGAFVDYDVSDISTDLAITAPGAPLTINADVTVDSQLSVGLRAGWLPTDAKDTLWYAMLGYTHVEFDDASISGTGGLTFSASAPLPDFSGYFVGAGVETMLMPNVSLKAEYRFTQLSDESLFQIPGTLDLTLEPSLHTARVAVSYRFPIRHDVIEEPYK